MGRLGWLILAAFRIWKIDQPLHYLKHAQGQTPKKRLCSTFRRFCCFFSRKIYDPWTFQFEKQDSDRLVDSKKWRNLPSFTAYTYIQYIYIYIYIYIDIHIRQAVKSTSYFPDLRATNPRRLESIAVTALLVVTTPEVQQLAPKKWWERKTIQPPIGFCR